VAEDRDAPDKVAEFARQKKLTHRIFAGGGRIADLYDFDRILPTAFLIDHRGRVVRRETGFRPEMAKEIERTLEDLLRARDADAGKEAGAAGAPAPAGDPTKRPETR
jgi:hypothetical protein